MKFTDHPLLTDSLVITKPLHRRSRWPVAAAITLHAAAAGGLIAQGWFAFEHLAPPELQRLTKVVMHPGSFTPQPAGSPRSGGGGGGGSQNGGRPQPTPRHRPPSILTPPSAPGNPEPAAPATGIGPGTEPGDLGPGDVPGGPPGWIGPGDEPSQPPGEPGGDLVMPYAVTDPPVVRERFEPNYPDSARAMGLEGRVIIQFIIDENGTVTDIKVVEASHALFREPALQAARRWKFSAAAVDGRKVRTYKTVTMKFELN